MMSLWAVVKVFVKGWIHSASAGFLMLPPNQTWWSHIFHILFDFFLLSKYVVSFTMYFWFIGKCLPEIKSIVCLSCLFLFFFFFHVCFCVTRHSGGLINRCVRVFLRASVWVCARTCSFPVCRVPRSHFALDNSPLRMGGTQSLYSPQGHMTRGLRRETTPVTVAVLWQITSRASQQRAHYACLMPDLSARSGCCFNKFQVNADKREDESVLVQLWW